MSFQRNTPAHDNSTSTKVKPAPSPNTSALFSPKKVKCVNNNQRIPNVKRISAILAKLLCRLLLLPLLLSSQEERGAAEREEKREKERERGKILFKFEWGRQPLSLCTAGECHD